LLRHPAATSDLPEWGVETTRLDVADVARPGAGPLAADPRTPPFTYWDSAIANLQVLDALGVSEAL